MCLARKSSLCMWNYSYYLYPDENNKFVSERCVRMFDVGQPRINRRTTILYYARLGEKQEATTLCNGK